MVIRTNTARLLKHRRMILELLLASHNCSCTTCEKSGDCRLQELAMRFGVRRVRFVDSREESQLDDSSPAVVRDPSKVHPVRRLCAGVRGDAGHEHPELRQPGQRPGGVPGL